MHETSVENPNQSANHHSHSVPKNIDTKNIPRRHSLSPAGLLLTTLLALAAHSPAQEQPQTPAPAASPSSASSNPSTSNPLIPPAPPAQAAPAPSKAVAYKRQFKHLKRIPPEPGTLAAHPCAKEYAYRLEDFLASLTDKEIAEYEKKAVDRTGLDGWKADPDAMYFLSQVIRADAEGQRYSMPDKNVWLLRAAIAGHPVALYQQALQDRSETPMSDTEILKRAEAAAETQGSGEIAWQMANGYARTGLAPKEFQFLPADADKARHWTKWAAERANIPAAERLCVGYARDAQATKADIAGDAAFDIKNGDPQNDEQAVHWCVLAAQATCSAPSASALGTLFERGLGGLPKDALTELYWRKTGEYRQRRLSAAKWGAEEEASERHIPLRQDPIPYLSEVTEFSNMRDWRMQNFLAGLTEIELAVYEKRAEAGDSDAAYLLSNVPKQNDVQRLIYPLRERWLPVALKANHPLARLEHERQQRYVLEKKSLGQADLPLIEAAALADGSGRIARSLGKSYQGIIYFDTGNYYPRYSLPRDMKKRHYWTKLAATRGNLDAVGLFCGCSFSNTDPVYLKDCTEIPYWCFLRGSSSFFLPIGLNIASVFSPKSPYWPESVSRQWSIKPDMLSKFYWEQSSSVFYRSLNTLHSKEWYLLNLQERSYE